MTNWIGANIGYDTVEEAYPRLYTEEQLSCYCDSEGKCHYHAAPPLRSFLADLDNLIFLAAVDAYEDEQNRKHYRG